jgi:putative DNA primase/helicase
MDAQTYPPGYQPIEATPRLLLDPGDPMAAARALMEKRFLVDRAHTLYRHRGAFWLWTGSYFRLADDEMIRSTIWNFLDSCSKLAKKDEPVPFKPNRAQVSNVYDALAATCLLDDRIEPPSWIGLLPRAPAAELFACSNGLLHLPARKLIPPTPEFFGLYASEAPFRTDAPTPRAWLSFLDELWGDDAESIQALQEFFGYLLSSDTSQQKILLMVGPKRSGKGTVARILSALLGRNSVAGPTMSSLGERFGLESLITAAAAIISDARIGSRSDKAAVTERLLSISGEDSLTVDRKFRQAWIGRLPTRLAILTNELPALTDGSGALASRFLVLLLTKSFYDKEDPSLTRKLIAELPGILHWAIEGYRSLNKRGHFIQPQSAIEARDDIEALASPVKAFIRDCCEVAPGRQISVDALWAEYRAWGEREGREAGNKAWFGRNLMSAAPGVQRARLGTRDDRTNTYEGIGLNR